MLSSVVLYTAGIDSFILLDYIRQNVDHETTPVYFNLKHRYANVEETLVVENESECLIDDSIELGKIEKDNAFIPNRNIFLTLGAASKYSNTVYIGGSLSDRVVDNNKGVFDEFSEFLTKLNKEKVTITSPFWDCYKVDMARWYVKHSGSNIDLLLKTFSCFNPTIKNSVRVWDSKGAMENDYESKHCFACNACFRRNVILYSVGIKVPFFNKDIRDSYQKEFNGALLQTPRSNATLNYIDWLEMLRF